MQTQHPQAQSYRNVMEALVAAEVKQQLRYYPSNLAQYINKTEVETYALNRLPPFYASCTEGWRKQKARAESEFRNEIRQAVRQGFAAVQRDPIRMSTPITLTEAQEYQRVRETLLTLQELLQPDEPSWRGLAKVAKRMLARAQLTKKPIAQLTAQPSDHWTQLHQHYRY